MAYQFKRGNTSDNNAYTGDSGSISIDFEGENVRVHDGTTSGGIFRIGVPGEGGLTSVSLSSNYASGQVTITNSGGSNATINSATSTNAGVMSASDKSKLDGISANADVSPSDTDGLGEGSSNLYFTEARAKAAIPSASKTEEGTVSTGTQTFSGNKTFTGTITIDEGEL